MNIKIKTRQDVDFKPFPMIDHIETQDGRVVAIDHLDIFPLRRICDEWKELMVAHLRYKRREMGKPVVGRPKTQTT